MFSSVPYREALPPDSANDTPTFTEIPIGIPLIQHCKEHDMGSLFEILGMGTASAGGVGTSIVNALITLSGGTPAPGK